MLQNTDSIEYIFPHSSIRSLVRTRKLADKRSAYSDFDVPRKKECQETAKRAVFFTLDNMRCAPGALILNLLGVAVRHKAYVFNLYQKLQYQWGQRLYQCGQCLCRLAKHELFYAHFFFSPKKWHLFLVSSLKNGLKRIMDKWNANTKLWTGTHK